MADPTYPLFSVFAFISFILVLIPFPWHLQAWNSGTCLYMLWTALGCLNLFINSIIWHDNAIDSAPVWCDISTRIIVAVSVAIPAASLCINRRLYKIASCQTASITRAEKKRAVIVDLAIGLGIPLIQIPLQYVVQGHRYDLFEDIGCYPTTVNTPPAYPLSFVWPSVIGIISAVYCVLTIRAFMRRRAEFSQFLSRNTSLTVSRYFRLMALATAELLFNLPLTSYGLYLNATGQPIYKWVSWANTHFEFSQIDTFPALVWRADRRNVINFELSRWALVFCAMLFFAFFGFAEEARKNYTKAYLSVLKVLGVRSQSAKTSAASKALSGPKSPLPNSSIGTFVPRPLQLKSNKSDSSFTCAKASMTEKARSAVSVHREVIHHYSKEELTHKPVYTHTITLPTASSYSPSSDSFTLAPTSPTETISSRHDMV